MLMNYQKIHDQIILRAKSENRVKFQSTYYENHHIIPKCLGGSNDKSNLVLLTAREHFLVHWLLHRIQPDNSGLSFAFWKLTHPNTSKTKRLLTVSSRSYQEAREANAEASKKLHLGSKHSVETKAKRKATLNSESVLLQIKENWKSKSKEEIDEIVLKRFIKYNNKTQEEKDAIIAKQKISNSKKSDKEKQERLNKLSIAGKERVKSFEERENIRTGALNRKYNKFIILAYNFTTGEFVKEFKSITAAEKYFKTRNIRPNIKNEITNVKGCVFFKVDKDQTISQEDVFKRIAC